MSEIVDVNNACCASLELSKSSWLCAFDVPGIDETSLHKIAARDVDGLVRLLNRNLAKAEDVLKRELTVTLCFEAGYDGFWIARMLIAKGIDTIVFDPASFLRPRRGRVAKTDRLDAIGMCRTLRTWLSGDHSVASSVQIQSIEEEDAKRIVGERKYLVQQRGRVVSRIKGILALHGIHLPSKGIGKALAARITDIKTAEGHPIPTLARRDIERMLQCHDLLGSQIAEVDAERTKIIKTMDQSFPFIEKVSRLSQMAGVGEVSAAVLVVEVYHREFKSRRHLASFIGLAPSPYASGETSRDRGINKAGTKLARQTLVELAWFWLRHQPESALSLWWKERFGDGGMRGRKVGIVALARKIAIALWRFVEFGVIPEGAELKT